LQPFLGCTRNFGTPIFAKPPIWFQQIILRHYLRNSIYIIHNNIHNTDMNVSRWTQGIGYPLQAVLSHVSLDVKVLDSEKGLKTFGLFSAIDVIVDKTLVIYQRYASQWFVKTSITLWITFNLVLFSGQSIL
jgi:hypothetical protein